jgi:small subunit ribosomal protein S2
MKFALFGERLGVCIFDLNITRELMIRALNFVAHIAYRGGIILFVSANRFVDRFTIIYCESISCPDHTCSKLNALPKK